MAKEEDKDPALKAFLNLRMNSRKYNLGKYNSRNFLRMYSKMIEVGERVARRCEKDAIGTARPSN